MSELHKMTADAVGPVFKHITVRLEHDHNKQIVPEKTKLNYEIELDLGGHSPQKYYEKILGESYLYGRGTIREKDAITCCSWVITLPKSVSDYSTIPADDIRVINPEEERSFFEGVTKFIQERYGTVFMAKTHYDEGGQPHIHVLFLPQTDLDHDRVKYKTKKDYKAIKTESGRYEFQSKFVLENGEKIPVKNYAKMTDYYDKKISAADVINKAELQHFHDDLQAFLRRNNVPGADAVKTGITAGKNIAVRDLKLFTEATGITLDELKEQPREKEVLSELLANAKLPQIVKVKIEAINATALVEKQRIQLAEQQKLQSISKDMNSEISKKNLELRQLRTELFDAKLALAEYESNNSDLEKKVQFLEENLAEKNKELEQAQNRIKELEKEKNIAADAAKEQPREWGDNSSWGSTDYDQTWGGEKTW